MRAAAVPFAVPFAPSFASRFAARFAAQVAGLAALGAACVLAGCASAPAQRSAAPSAPAFEPLSVANADYVWLEEGPCFGSCPVYRMTLYPDGQYVLMGERFTEGEGRSDNKPSEDSFDRAKEALSAANFMELPEDITTNNPEACPNAPTDHATVEITVGRNDGFYRTMRYYLGCQHDVAETLLRQLRTIMRVSDLVRAAGPADAAAE